MRHITQDYISNQAVTMETRELARTDRNLPIALPDTREERNVSRAAERLFITQPGY
jgi:hypothetical protein